MRILRRHVAALLLVPLFSGLLACAGQDGMPLGEGGLRVEPGVADIAPGESVRFSAIGDELVEWTVLEEGGGAVDADGTYTAPDAEGTYHVVARTAGDLTASAEVRVARQNSGPVTITPKAASVVAGLTLAFQAAASGVADARVTWSVAEGDAGGTITADGLYTAPAAAGVFHVVATSVADARATATAAVTVTPAPVPEPPKGPQLYVATDGDDANPGTADRPWRTIQKAMNAATPGSTVNIRGGTYREMLVANVSGTAGNPITFQPYGFQGSAACGGYTGKTCPGEPVVIDYSGFGVIRSPKPAFHISGRQYLVVQGLTFQNYSVDGAMHVGILINGGSHHVDFRWVRVENFRNVHTPGLDGTSMLAPVRVGWLNSTAHDVTFSDSQFYNSKTNMSEVLTYDLEAANGSVVRSHFRDSDGIALHAYRGAHHFVFRDNLFEWCGVKRDGTYPDGQPSATIYNDGGRDGLIEGNVVRNSAWAIQSLAEWANPSQGLSALPPAYNIVIRNNVVTGSKAGIVVGTWYSNVDGSTVHHHDIYNNTIHNSDIGFLIRPFQVSTVRVRNNIVAGCRTAFSNGIGWNVAGSFDYNLYAGGGVGPDVHVVQADPRFANAAAGDFTLLPGSPAIDAGDPATTPASAGETALYGGPRFVGGRVDLGALEAR